MRKVVLYLIIFLIAVFSQCSFAFAASNLEEGVKILAEQISKSMIERQSKKIAVIDFSDLNGNVTDLGRFIAEELTTQLFTIASGKFEIMERRKLLKLEEELTLSQTGFIEEKSIKKMGQVLGIDAIVTGSITDMGNTYRVNARLIGVESAKVFAVAATDISTEKKLPTSEKKASIPPQQPVQEIEAGVFQNNFFKITVKSAKKRGSTITLLLLYENITNKNIRMDIHNEAKWIGGTLKSEYPYLMDENGEKWTLMSADNIGFTWTTFGFNLNPTDFLPGVPTLVRLAFSAKGNPDGTLFTSVIDHGNTSHLLFQAVIHKIPLTE